MKYSLVNGERAEAQPGLRGTCENCQSETIAKCGSVKIKHWAHKSKFSCDPWWENETEWHRSWKNHFPMEWQENIHTDSTTGEKHIADIKTASGLVIEFQHSAIKPAEIQSREAFYKNMVWVVDGTRLKRDYLRFCKGFSELKPTIVEGFFRLFFPDECLPASWVTSSAPVYFDFQSITPLDQPDEMRDSLWCLLPGRVDKYAVVARISRKQFIDFSSNNLHLLPTQDRLSDQEKYIQSQLAEAVEEKKRKDLQAAAYWQRTANLRRGRHARL